METENKDQAVVLTKYEAHEIETTPDKLLQLAVSKDLDIHKLEKLMELMERWQANKARTNFFEALTLFQSLVPEINKSKQVAFDRTKYSFAPLGAIAATIKESLHHAALSYRWEFSDTADQITCTCIIAHKDGHTEKSSMSAKKDSSGSKNEIQSRGSTMTYLQRYTLIGALGLSTADEDNDGHKEPEPAKQTTTQQTTKAPAKQTTMQPAAAASDKPVEKPFLQIWADASKKDYTQPGVKAINSLLTGQVTIEQIEKKYQLTPDVKIFLLTQQKSKQL